MVQYSEHQRNKGSDKTEMNEQDKIADNTLSSPNVTLTVLGAAEWIAWGFLFLKKRQEMWNPESWVLFWLTLIKHLKGNQPNTTFSGLKERVRNPINAFLIHFQWDPQANPSAWTSVCFSRLKDSLRCLIPVVSPLQRRNYLFGLLQRTFTAKKSRHSRTISEALWVNEMSP